MKKNLDFERRMYAGYPVYIAVYFDQDNNRYSFTTLSSIYNLGRMVVVGCGKNNFLKCITEQKSFTINFLSYDYIKDFYIGGEDGKKVSKFEKSSLELEDVKIDNFSTKVVKQADLVYSCSVVEVCHNDKFPMYYNIISNMDNVLVDEKHYKDNSFDVTQYEPFLFIGTDQGRYFRIGNVPAK